MSVGTKTEASREKASILSTQNKLDPVPFQLFCSMLDRPAPDLADLEHNVIKQLIHHLSSAVKVTLYEDSIVGNQPYDIGDLF